jgi:hypothetical protein
MTRKNQCRTSAREAESISSALKRQRRRLGADHKLDLSGPIQFDELLGLCRLGVQKLLKELDLSNAPLTSLHTLQAQPWLKSLRADNSRIEVLTGLERQTALSSLSLVGAPVAERQNFRIGALIVAPKLADINGEKVTMAERRMAQTYPPIAKALIGAGWVVQYPPPSEADFRFLAKTFDVNVDEKDCVLPATAGVPPSKSAAGSPEKEEKEVSFGERVAGMLGDLGFPIRIGERMEEDILESVGVLCSVVTKIEGLAADAIAQ